MFNVQINFVDKSDTKKIKTYFATKIIMCKVFTQSSKLSSEIYIWMLHMPNRLTPYAKRDVEVEKNDKILYIAFKFLIKQVKKQ